MKASFLVSSAPQPARSGHLLPPLPFHSRRFGAAEFPFRVVNLERSNPLRFPDSVLRSPTHPPFMRRTPAASPSGLRRNCRGNFFPHLFRLLCLRATVWHEAHAEAARRKAGRKEGGGERREIKEEREKVGGAERERERENLPQRICPSNHPAPSISRASYPASLPPPLVSPPKLRSLACLATILIGYRHLTGGARLGTWTIYPA